MQLYHQQRGEICTNEINFTVEIDVKIVHQKLLIGLKTLFWTRTVNVFKNTIILRVKFIF